MVKIKYKLYNDRNEDLSIIQQILYNRGIEVDDQETWLNAGWPQINDWRLLDEEKMRIAVDIIESIVENNEYIMVVVDSDSDGFTSAAIFINYLYKCYPEYTKEYVKYILHTGKQHGLEDTIDDILQNSLPISAVVCPDSSSNDIAQHYLLEYRGINCIVLDHHECDKESVPALVINNQMCDYPNKDFSGAGITWQFCRAYDELKGFNYANDFTDLCALGNLSDMMSYRNLETRAIVNIGLNNIKNPFFYYMVEKNKFSIDKMGGINYMSIAFYVTPFINAMVRSGTQEEKDLVFRSMLLPYAFEKRESEKRGHKGELVDTVEEAIRVAVNVKARQTKLQDEGMELLESRIKEQNLLDNAIIVLCCEPGEVEKNIAGLCANKIQAKYQHPTLVLTKSKTKDDKEYFFRGSARNYGHAEIEDMRQLCVDTGLLEYGQGHEGAWGCSIPESNLSQFIEATNQAYGEVSTEPVYWVDTVWNNQTISPSDILTVAEAKDIWGQGIPEPYIYLKDICLSENNVQLLSPDNHPTIKIHLPCGIDIMKFKASEELYKQCIQPNMVLTAVGKCAKNEWNGHITPQIIIEDMQLEEKWVF